MLLKPTLYQGLQRNLMCYILLRYSPLENDLVREFVGFWEFAFSCQLFCGMDPGSIFIYGGWDLYESDPNVC